MGVCAIYRGGVGAGLGLSWSDVPDVPGLGMLSMVVS